MTESRGAGNHLQPRNFGEQFQDLFSQWPKVDRDGPNGGLFSILPLIVVPFAASGLESDRLIPGAKQSNKPMVSMRMNHFRGTLSGFCMRHFIGNGGPNVHDRCSQFPKVTSPNVLIKSKPALQLHAGTKTCDLINRLPIRRIVRSLSIQAALLTLRKVGTG
jgi:hypothetical protein